MTIPESARIHRLALACAALFMLSGCGGGAGDAVAAAGASGGISGSGNSVGTVSGFGSIILNDRRFDTSRATIVVEGAAASQSDLRVGQLVVVDADFDDLEASPVEYRAQIKGPVQALTLIDPTLGMATLTVLGQSVATNSATNFEGARLDPAATNALKVGDIVEVSGIADADGVLIAGYLESKPALTEYKVVGSATNVTATTFRIGALTVDYSHTGATVPSGGTIEVKAGAADFDAAANRLVASTVETLGALSLSSGDALELEGYITRFASATDFDINGVRTTTNASTTFEDGSVASLGFNVRVEVEGVMNASGTVLADRIEIESTGSVRIEGDVEQVTLSPQRLRVLGVTFAVRPETDLEDDSDAEADPFEFGDIVVGDRIEMRGFLDGATVVASELSREDPDSDALLRGRVTAKNVGAAQVTILGVTVTGDADTEYDDLGGQAEFFDAVTVGDFVTAQWQSFSSTSTPADQLSLEDD